ncbi:hypothetical protein GCM10007071_18510 [Marinobacter zhanjiangensis]|uniref:diguanylate cyclase n=1 Tax=Marinobacter zhanjiangensis TaxID=578215 RepID=A0ABQ3AYJ3_9GAMM|nr:hypothetical protein GCM10007071_18510 [Marinobacter zhanjiangensis]
MSVNDVQASLVALRSKFSGRAREEILFLSRQAEKMSEGKLTGAELSEAYHVLHRLAGSAGTFGLPDLGEAARVLEKSLKPHVERLAATGVADDAIAPVEPLFLRGIEGLFGLVTDQPASVPDSQNKTVEGVDDDSHGTQVRILVCHQSADVRLSLVQGLARYGFQCLEVSLTSPDLAGVIAESSRVASVFVVGEQQLEGVASECRSQNVGGRQLPVLCLAGHDSFEKRYWAAEAGAEGFFSEPLDFPRLADSIERLVSERRYRLSGRVLIVEDDSDLAEHYRLVLESSGVEVRLVSDTRHLMQDLAEFQPDIVLMDVNLAGRSGITLARLIRFEPRWLSLPIIYLSSEDDPESQLVAMSEGADEFLSKPITDDYLVRSVLHRCHRARQLSELMNRDSLTGLLKHALVKQQVHKELASCRRLGYRSCVAMVDLDHFKQVNDTWGHGCGDRVIKALANLLKNRLRETDVIGRYGGEEFVVVLPGCDVGQAQSVIEGIGRSFSELLFFGNDEDSFSVTLSAGIAALNDFSDGDVALEAADQALYQRKSAGRNGVSVYTVPE